MKLSFYGADRCVTGSCHCLEVNGKRILVDCGLQQGRDEVDNTALPFHPGSIDAVLVTPSCGDPLYRRAARVSMGTVFQIPWTRIGGDDKHFWPRRGLEELRSLGFTTVAMALSDDSISLDELTRRLNNSPESADHIDKLALIFGTEGDGLSRHTIAGADLTVKIPMSHGVDSLNVAASSAVAFYATSPKRAEQ